MSPLRPLRHQCGGVPVQWFQAHPALNPHLTARGKMCNNPEPQPAAEHGRDMEFTHRHSNSQSRAASAKAQSALQIADKLVSPGSILFSQRTRPPPLQPSHVRAVSDDMDRRHPSSFQQLEKVSLHRVDSTEAWLTIHSSVKEPMPQYALCLPHPQNPVCPLAR
jgi:hypothetical protein